MSDERQDPPDRIAQIRQREQQATGDDFAWAKDRVVKMCGSALADAMVYGKKLLKGFGYPNETFRAAQDHRALSIVLAELDRLQRERNEHEASAIHGWSEVEHQRGHKEEYIVFLQAAEQEIARLKADWREQDVVLQRMAALVDITSEPVPLMKIAEQVEQEIARLSKEVAICQSQRAHAEAANQGLRAQVRELTTLQKQAGDTIARQAVENDRLADTIARLRAQVAEAQVEIETLRKEQGR